MNLKLTFTAAAGLAVALCAFAAEPAPAPSAPIPAATPGATQPAAPAAPTIETHLQELISRIQAKLRSGAQTKEALADELKAFDALLAAHKDEKTEAVAHAAYMRGTLFLQILKDYDTAESILSAVQKDYPGTASASRAAQVAAMIPRMKEAEKMKEGLKVGTAFPDFQVKDLAGQPLSVAKYKGKVVLVDFWATWCGPCVGELPNVRAAYERYHDKGFEIIGISLDQSEQKLKDFLKENNVTWAQYFDGKGWSNEVSKKYGIQSIPATYLIDREGKIVGSDFRGQALTEELEKLLGK